MWREAKGDDVVLLIVFVEFCVHMPLMPIEYQYTLYTFFPAPGVLVKVLKLFKTYLIICLSILGRFYNLIGRDMAVAILRGEVVAALHA